MPKVLEEVLLKGISISKGIVIGRLFFLKKEGRKLPPSKISITFSEVEKEVKRYRRAIHISRDDLNDLQRFLAREGSSEAVAIIDTHIQMLEDPFLTTFMEKKIRECLKNAEVVFCSVISNYEKSLSREEGSVFKQRLLDVRDISERILGNLHLNQHGSMEVVIPQDSVVFTEELIPSTIARVSKEQVLGFITERGGAASHSALIARSKGLAYISNIGVATLYPFSACMVIMDGESGDVIINPTNKTLYEYKRKKERHKQRQSQVVKNITAQTRTADGVQINVLANIENLSDLDLLSFYKAEGIGLFRSEYLCLGREFRTFSEEEQFALYRQVMERMRGLPVVFRVFDVGGDKGDVPPYHCEPNPALGCRAIRYLLRNKELFTLQLRALLRVSLDGDLHILLPLISDVSELLQAKELIQRIAIDLCSEGYEIAKEISIGAMLEVPSAVVTCDLIARECDFVSIGTNDLIQYTLAADRATQDVHSFYQPTHPSIIWMIRHIIKEAAKSDTSVSLCGEMASDPLMVPLLIGLGIRKLSCASRYIPLIKKMIERIYLKGSEDIAEEILKMETHEQISTLLKEKYQKLVFEIS